MDRERGRARVRRRVAIGFEGDGGCGERVVRGLDGRLGRSSRWCLVQLFDGVEV